MRTSIILFLLLLIASPLSAQEIWSHTIDLPYTYLLRALAPGSGTTVRFAGSGPTQAMAGELTTEGELLWSYEWGGGNGWTAEFNAAVTLSNQHLLLAGGEFYEDEWDVDWHSSLRHLDDQGILVEYIAPGSACILNTVDVSAEGIYVSGDGGGSYLARIAPNGTILHESSLGNDYLVAHPSGGVLVGGASLIRYLSGTLSQIWSDWMGIYDACLSHEDDFIVIEAGHVVHRLDIDGNVVWSTPVDDAVVVTPYVFGGYVVVAPPADFTMLDNDGNVTSTFSDPDFQNGWIQDVVCDETGLITTARSSGEVIFVRLDNEGSLSISLQPHNNQVPIPPTGGVLYYGAQCENLTGTPFAGDAWTSVLTPGGTTVPVQVFALTLDPYQTLQVAERNILIPYVAPPGMYYFKGALGSFPNQIAAIDSFAFYKSGWPAGQEPENRFEGSIELNEDENSAILR